MMRSIVEYNHPVNNQIQMPCVGVMWMGQVHVSLVE